MNKAKRSAQSGRVPIKRIAGKDAQKGQSTSGYIKVRIGPPAAQRRACRVRTWSPPPSRPTRRVRCRGPRSRAAREQRGPQGPTRGPTRRRAPASRAAPADLAARAAPRTPTTRGARDARRAAPPASRTGSSFFSFSFYFLLWPFLLSFFSSILFLRFLWTAPI